MARLPNIDDLINAVSGWLAQLPDQEKPIGATVEIPVNPMYEQKFAQLSEQLAIETRKQSGLEFYTYGVCRPDSPSEAPNPPDLCYLITERWKTVKDFRENQWGSKHLIAFQRAIGRLIVGAPRLKFFHSSPAQSAVLPLSSQSVGWHKTRFKNNYDGTITDTLTNLVWLEDANPIEREVSFEEAIRQASLICDGKFGLRDGSEPGDWRVPNVNQLQSLIDLSNKSGLAITPNVFKNVDVVNCWTSTSVQAFPQLGWYVALGIGPPVFDLKINKMRLWPVRGSSLRVLQTGQSSCFDLGGNIIPCAGSGQDAEFAGTGLTLATPRFRVNMTRDKIPRSDGTVTDLTTGLTWLQNGDAFGTRSWDEAKALCKALSQDQFEWLNDGSKPGDWDLPNVNELRSLEDYGEARPALAKGHPFVNVRESLVWSNTELESAPTLARFLYVGIGSCVWDHKSVRCGVWPVKGGMEHSC